MPAKGKKVAARQSQINKRKKRQPRKLAVGQTAVAAAPIATSEVAETTTPRASRAPRATGRIATSGPSAYNFMGSELLRIGLFSVPILIVLGVLAWYL
tara:strand:+ start:151 stop:444 length:294 start_codon:yes stop_codon:yes gene_type:complete